MAKVWRWFWLFFFPQEIKRKVLLKMGCGLKIKLLLSFKRKNRFGLNKLTFHHKDNL